MSAAHTCVIHQVDAFASRPFRGNPAAVCILEQPADSQWMQLVAREMNLSETAFVWPAATEADSPDAYALRWFAPATEVDRCGFGKTATGWSWTFRPYRPGPRTLRQGS
ncbi:MAG: PhzF family phenazine biosynthesis protein [Thermoleophilia bacterium]|nr:PhzF family phenazine biosynthesis protein [Thermoleophilia bacterium]